VGDAVGPGEEPAGRRFHPQTDAPGVRKTDTGGMSSAIVTPGPVHSAGPGPVGPSGATAVTDEHRAHRVGDALRALKVFVSTAFGVAVLGEYAQEAGVRTRGTHA
jgi:hypothetical protein